VYNVQNYNTMYTVLRERVYDVYSYNTMYIVLIYADRLYSIINVVATALWFAGRLHCDMTINIIPLKSELRHIIHYTAC